MRRRETSRKGKVRLGVKGEFVLCTRTETDIRLCTYVYVERRQEPRQVMFQCGGFVVSFWGGIEKEKYSFFFV